MENLALVSAKPVLGLGYSPNTRGLPLPLRCPSLTKSKSRTLVRASSGSTARRVSRDGKEKPRVEFFARIFSSGGGQKETTTVGVNPQPVTAPPPPSSFGSPIFWIGVGVGCSALFSWLASYLKKYAMQQAFKTMMGSQNSQFGNTAFSPGSPFPFPPPPINVPSSTPGPAASSWPASNAGLTPSTKPDSSSSPAPKSDVAVDIAVSAKSVEAAPTKDVKDEEEVVLEPKKIAFQDVSPEETLPKSPFEKFEDSSTSPSSQGSKYAEPEVVVENGASSNAGAGTTKESAKSTRPGLSVEALEKMMEDPTVQQMVYPYLPEEMRNPATFKWMLQNPEYRKQLEDMLSNMSGTPEWDQRIMDNLKNFDISSPEVKQQFDQIGLTPEEVISKIMANPDVAMAFQNPRVQAAIMDCSQNPFNIAKYQNDKEVMDVFNKISQLFPGVGSP